MVRTQKGDDRVTYRLRDDLTTERKVDIHLGEGDNRATIDIDDRRIREELNISVRGDNGSADITASIDAVLSEATQIVADMTTLPLIAQVFKDT